MRLGRDQGAADPAGSGARSEVAGLRARAVRFCQPGRLLLIQLSDAAEQLPRFVFKLADEGKVAYAMAFSF
jgi:hypothetical protein